MIITTVPIKIPENNPKYGILAMVFLTKVIGQKLGIQSYLGLNVPQVKCGANFDANAHIAPLVEWVQKFDIAPDKTILDCDNYKYVIPKLTALYNNNYLIERVVPKVVCDCGMVDSLNHKNMRLDYVENGKCKFCGKPVKAIDVKSLLLKIPEHKIENNVIPYKLNKDFAEEKRKLFNRELLVSKNRVTGFNFMGYEIDQDMLNHMWLEDFIDPHRIMITSPHVIYQVALMDEVSRLFNPDAVTYHLVMSYFTGTPQFDRIKSDSLTDKYLYILNSLSTTSKEKKWQNNMIDTFLNRAGTDNKKATMLAEYLKPWDIDVTDLTNFYREFSMQYKGNFHPGQQKHR